MSEWVSFSKQKKRSVVHTLREKHKGDILWNDTSQERISREMERKRRLESVCEYVIYRLGRGLLCPVCIVCTPSLLSHNWLSIQKALFPPLWAQIKICPLCTNHGHLKCWALRFKTLLLTHFQTTVLSRKDLLFSLYESIKSSPTDLCFCCECIWSCTVLWMMKGIQPVMKLKEEEKAWS